MMRPKMVRTRARMRIVAGVITNAAARGRRERGRERGRTTVMGNEGIESDKSPGLVSGAIKGGCKKGVRG